jgi:hypothetical protein
MRPATFSSPVPDLARRVEDTSVVRDALHEAWRKLEIQMVVAGIPEGAAVQTMVTIAAEAFARVHGPSLAAEYFGAISSVFSNQAAQGERQTETELTGLPRSQMRKSPWRWGLPRLFPRRLSSNIGVPGGGHETRQPLFSTRGGAWC